MWSVVDMEQNSKHPVRYMYLDMWFDFLPSNLFVASTCLIMHPTNTT